MKRSIMIGTLLAAILGGFAPALAQQADGAGKPPAQLFGDAAIIDGAELANTTGSANLSMVIAANNSSNVSGNNIVGVSNTGGISFDEASLSNLSGLSVLSANTGNNVAINSSLNLNVAVRP